MIHVMDYGLRGVCIRLRRSRCIRFRVEVKEYGAGRVQQLRESSMSVGGVVQGQVMVSLRMFLLIRKVRAVSSELVS